MHPLIEYFSMSLPSPNLQTQTYFLLSLFFLKRREVPLCSQGTYLPAFNLCTLNIPSCILWAAEIVRVLMKSDSLVTVIQFYNSQKTSQI